MCSFRQRDACLRVLDAAQRVAVEEIRDHGVDHGVTSLMVHVCGRKLRGSGAISRAVWQAVRLAGGGVGVDGQRSGVAPLVGCAVEVVCAVVPEDGRGVVLCGCADEEVEVAPAGSGFGGDGAGVPLADYQGHVGEVVADGGEVGVEGGLGIWLDVL